MGRYLEHARIFAFAGALAAQEEFQLPGSANVEGQPDVFIGSADLMHRNLIRRVEALVSLSDETQIQGLINLLESSMADEISTWHLHPDNTWTREHLDSEGNPKLDLQQELINRQRKRLAL